MTHYLLKQYGTRPVQFDGTSLITANGICETGNLYCEVEIYAKTQGGYVARLLVDDDPKRSEKSLPSPSEIQFVKETSTEGDVIQFFRDFPMCDFAPGLDFDDLDEADPDAIDTCYAQLASHLQSLEDEYLSFIAATFPSAENDTGAHQSIRKQEF